VSLIWFLFALYNVMNSGS